MKRNHKKYKTKSVFVHKDEKDFLNWLTLAEKSGNSRESDRYKSDK